MVARITTPNSIQRALNYNEQKVKKGQAELLHASNYLKDTEKLTFYDKLNRFTDLISLNERAKTNALNISLNFHNDDGLVKEKLVEIAGEYMQAIGFGEQPFLVYQHHDSGHPHVHIVTTNIKHDGKRIDTFNIGRNQSEKARKTLEQKHRLIVAQGRRIAKEEITPVSQRIIYGKSETKRAIENVLAHVLNVYKYSSLAELNAVLKLYNITADPGSEHSRIRNHKGLVYRVLDAKGNKIGAPVKSSLLCNKSGLKFLQGRFLENESLKQPYKQGIKTEIDFILFKKSNMPLTTFSQALRKEGIDCVFRIGKDDFLYGITYIDHRNKCVFNGSDLGKQYSAKGIQERCSTPQIQQQTQALNASLVLKLADNNNVSMKGNILKLADDLLKPQINQNSNEPFEIRKFKKQKLFRQQH